MICTMKLFKSALIEGVVLLVMAVGAALAANALNGNGLQLSRNYFRKIEIAPDAPPTVPEPAGQTGETALVEDREPEGAPEPVVVETIPGLQVMSLEDVYEQSQYLDPGDNSILILDARGEVAYEESHIAGALLCDPWNEGKYLPALLPRVQEAFMIIAYCEGGDCEDSHLLVSNLVLEHGIPLENVYLFKAGYEAWLAKGYPVRTGSEP